ncbi:MAG: flagellar FlbD family protein [Treponema sp.]|uniref:flagellar FlbD family protein n=1 Tax=Treponema sp. TaxID=166 RepID=UPI001D9EEE73|nr:flagellar FlbD family protein [Treponema sp.]MCI5696898.1 flagellar FlbD family protein [Spirochaetia bacterium]MBS7310968.1 flagellar FlbD family protein [Treponema sp.]MCQ2600012.1 flagellar FlbD family protein [Treponema sp.]MDD5811600.1 flagellar FlbD family protein [Treponema sp.]MDY5885496.1 flagellar FlbD family protein [Treponema sp.]
MIELNKLNGAVFYLNPHLIESMECRPDLTITMMSGNTIVVKNSPQEVTERIIAYRKQLGIQKQEG